MPVSPILQALGEAVKELRRERGISQEALGHESGLHRNYIGGIERGERNPTYASLVRLATALDVRASQLLALSETIQANERSS